MKSPLKLLFIMLISGVAMATEEPSYKTVATYEEFEIREYQAILTAQTIVDEGFEDAGNAGFRILAKYIFGDNQSRTKISMTAPVAQVGKMASEKIEMTAPVNLVKQSSGYAVQFTIPKEFTKESLPLPNDARIKIVEVPPRKVAVYKYSGSWSEARYQEKLALFRVALKKNSIVVVGEPVFARYNSPIMIWFLRRNEIWLELAL
jgi:hypothetical protein